MSTELELLRDQFPDFDLTAENIRGRMRYISRSRHPGQNPHTVITGDPDEIRDALRGAGASETARLSGPPLREEDSAQ
jgi:hypothetical protein